MRQVFVLHYENVDGGHIVEVHMRVNEARRRWLECSDSIGADLLGAGGHACFDYDLMHRNRNANGEFYYMTGALLVE